LRYFEQAPGKLYVQGGVREGIDRARFVGFPKRYLSDFLVFLDNLLALILAIIS
jgi:hypothetical protein